MSGHTSSRPIPIRSAEPASSESDATTCPRCGESQELAKVKGCIKCLKCGFKFDCNGW
jgi:ribosomal protein S27AE